MKAPKNKLNARIVSFIEVTLPDSEVREEKEISQKSMLPVEKKCSNVINVLLLGYLDNPRIKCMKQLVNKASGSEIVSLAVKKAAGVQKFKLPFKNLSQYLDGDVEFAFIRTQKEPGAPVEPIDCMQFFCQPN